MKPMQHIPPAMRLIKVRDAGPDTIEEYDVVLTEADDGPA